MRIMIDLNVLLDYVQKRQPHFQFSSVVVSEVLKLNMQGFVPAHAVTTVYYICTKQLGRQRANEVIDWLLAKFEIVPAQKAEFIRARSLPTNDFEDAVVASLAETAACDFVVTRNVPDFKDSPIPAISPEEFVRRYLSHDETTPPSN